MSVSQGTDEEVQVLAWAKSQMEQGVESLELLQSLSPVFKRPALSEMTLVDGAEFITGVSELSEGDSSTYRLRVVLEQVELRYEPLFWWSCPRELPNKSRVCMKRVENRICPRCEVAVEPVPFAAMNKGTFKTVDGQVVQLSALGEVVETMLGMSASGLKDLEDQSVEACDTARQMQTEALKDSIGKEWDVAVLAERVKLENGKVIASCKIYSAKPFTAASASSAPAKKQRTQ